MSNKKAEDMGIKPTTYLLLLIAFGILWTIAKCAKNMWDYRWIEP